jgi:hypothetical protein
VKAITSYCAASCPQAIELTCQTPDKTGDASAEQVQVCTTTADCSGAAGGATACCAVLSYHVCLAPAVASLEGLTCLP